MTTEEAVGEELQEARHQEIMLFAKFMQSLSGDPMITGFIRE